MIFLAAEWAIFKRLAGYPVDSSGRPKLNSTTGKPDNSLIIGPPPEGTRKPSYGVRIPTLKGPHDLLHPLTSRNPDGTRLFERGMDPQNFRQIPVFAESVEGRKFDDIWPCVSFYLSDFQANEKTFVYCDEFGDPYGQDDSIENQNAEIIQEGKGQYRSRRHPESWDLSYTIVCWAKTPGELGLVVESLIYLFPQRGCLEVEQMDGTTLPLDMLLTSTSDMSAAKGSLALQIEKGQTAYAARAFTYKVEGYFDNTANKFGVNDTEYSPTIKERIIELYKIQQNLVVVTGDLNKQELNPILGG